MAFDPDEFLGEKKKKESAPAQQGGFDPDKFLAGSDTGPSAEPAFVAETPTPPPVDTSVSVGDVAMGTAGLAAAGAAGYGAYKAAAPYVKPVIQAVAPAMRQFPGAVAAQYAARPITGLAADAAAIFSGLPPPTATQEALRAMGQGGSAARQVVSTGPIAPTPAQVAGNPMLSEMAARQQAAASRSAWQKGLDMATKMREIASQKVMQNAGMLGKASVGLGALTYSGGLNTGEDEELRRRRMMAPTITR